jgi:hypothetical protein
MPFVWRDVPENPDLLWVAKGFAEHLAAGRWDEALEWADMAEEVFQGGYVGVPRDDGGCQIMTRQAKYCPNQSAAGERACGMHLRLIKRHEQDKADA